MFAFRDKVAIPKRFSRPYRVFQRKARNSHHSAPQASTGLVIDSKGIILDCSDDLLQAIGAGREQVVGRHVRALIPTLPFQAATEGYNIAYATFAAARKEACTWRVNTVDGSHIDVTGRLAIYRMTDSYAIRLMTGSVTPDARLPHREGRAAHHQSAHVASQSVSPSGAESLNGMAPRTELQVPLVRRASHVRLMLDDKYRIGFASSTLEDLFGIDYEQVVGVPASVLLPDLQNHLGHASTLRNARTRLQKMGPFVSHARHANGNAIPVTVSLLEGSVDRLVALQLEVTIY